MTPRGGHSIPKGGATWDNVPSPRGSHTATLIDGKVYVFGGYGGPGYSRRDLDDLTTLDVESMEWVKVKPAGLAPEKRSGHQAVAVDKKLYIFGGSNSITQFNDLHISDTEEDVLCWANFDNSLGGGVQRPRWNHAACSVMAIPSWKVFLFGGRGGQLDTRQGGNTQGTFLNDVGVLDTGVGVWQYPNYGTEANDILGDPPAPRADCAMDYDHKGSRLIVFGGWANEWYDEVYMLDVGPPYAIMDVYPTSGPITGNTALSIEGIDFYNTQQVIVRFSSKKGACEEVRGVYVSGTKITCTSPDFSRWLPGDVVEVRVALGTDSYTTTFQTYTFFPVTNAANSLLFGPGVLDGCCVGEEVNFIIQARDLTNKNRTTGGDEFDVRVRQRDVKLDSEGDETVSEATVHGVFVEDRADGTYSVTFTAPNPGEFLIDVEFKGTYGGAAGHVRGSPCTARFEEFVSRENNTMGGKIVQDSVKDDLKYLLEFTSATQRGVSAKVQREDDPSWTPELAVNALVKVKEHLTQAESEKIKVEFLLDRTNAVVAYLKMQGKNIGPMEAQLARARSTWQEVLTEIPQTHVRIAPLVKAQGAKTRSDIKAYQEGVEKYQSEVGGGAFKNFDTGHLASLEMLDVADDVQTREQKRCEEMLHLANMFECPKDMQASQTLMLEIGEELSLFRELWAAAAEANMYVTD
jgi:dynein heavy chain